MLNRTISHAVVCCFMALAMVSSEYKSKFSQWLDAVEEYKSNKALLIANQQRGKTHTPIFDTEKTVIEEKSGVCKEQKPSEDDSKKNIIKKKIDIKSRPAVRCQRVARLCRLEAESNKRVDNHSVTQDNKLRPKSAPSRVIKSYVRPRPKSLPGKAACRTVRRGAPHTDRATTPYTVYHQPVKTPKKSFERPQPKVKFSPLSLYVERLCSVNNLHPHCRW